MKKTAQLLTLIMLTTQLFGNPQTYSTDTEYKLLNNLEIAKQQKNYIENMGRLLKLNIKDKESFILSKELFNQVIKGLISNNKLADLNEAEFRKMNLKISKIKRVWKEEKSNFEMALSDKNSRLKAIHTVEKLSFYMRGVIAVHNKSYVRYTKNHSKPSSLFARNRTKSQLMSVN